MAGKTANAGATKSNSSSTKKTSVQDARDRYIAELEAENARLQAEIERKIDTLKTADIEVEEEDFTVSPNEYVKVMSLVPDRLNLCTKERGQGNIYKFDKIFQTKRIIYNDLASILEVNRKFLEEGYFVILNKKVVRMNGLDEIQEANLTKEMIEEILKGTDEGVALYASAREGQKAMIIDTIVRNLVENPDSLDLNMVDKLSRISKINIADKVNDSRFLFLGESVTE